MGLELPCLYTTQVIKHVDCLLLHGGTETITGQLLDGTIEKAKVEPLLTTTAISSQNVGLKTYGKSYTYTKIKVMEKTASLTLKRDNGVFLNKQFLSKGYPKSQ